MRDSARDSLLFLLTKEKGISVSQGKIYVAATWVLFMSVLRCQWFAGKLVRFHKALLREYVSQGSEFCHMGS